MVHMSPLSLQTLMQPHPLDIPSVAPLSLLLTHGLLCLPNEPQPAMVHYYTISSFRFREVANLEADLCLIIRIPVWIERALSKRLWSFHHLLRHRIDLFQVAGCLFFHFGAARFHIGEPLTSCSTTTSYPSGPSCSSQTQSMTQLYSQPLGLHFGILGYADNLPSRLCPRQRHSSIALVSGHWA
jgi:hypothetical protein